MFNKVRFIFMT